MQFSIVIVSYNAVDHLQFCLESCEKAILHHEAEVLVIDNHSPDRNVERLEAIFPRVNFYFLDQNLGFSKANNFGVKRAKGEYVLILNPDTIIPENLFDELMPFDEKTQNVGMVGVRLVDANGNFHPESKRNLPTVKNSFSKLFNIRNTTANTYYKEDVAQESVAPCSILVGAFMWVKKSIYQEIGGFDERYFMYGEDIDISHSSELAGYTNFYKGDQIVLHYKGESTKKDKKYFRIFFDAMKLFVEKYYGQQFLKRNLLMLGISVKYYVSLMQHHFPKKSSNRIVSKEFVWLKKNNQITQFSNSSFVLCTSIFSFKEILDLITRYNSPYRNFYIHSHLSQKIIGNEGVETLAKK